ncbi:MAG: hydrogenase formation protein HypD [Bacteroidales bacterium]|nr:hydrogenase formation protein HypD [Bacteroidales bacterium]
MFDQFHSKELCENLIDQIRHTAHTPVRFMEVCGGHTMAIRKFGIPSLLPETISLLSGPGCPVCVTSTLYIDRAVFLSHQKDVIVCTFGDLLRVPGNYGSLEKAKTEGRNIRIVLSSTDALELARQNPQKKIVFLGIGFETTAPATAAAILQAKQNKLKNFFVLSTHKLMPPAMEALIAEGVAINGYICPGHVTTITGTSMYKRIAEDLGIGCVVSGFEPLDLLFSILLLLKQHNSGRARIEIQYSRAVKPEGNKKAIALMEEVFEPVDDWWRGLGILTASGLKPKSKYCRYDASANFDLPNYAEAESGACICGDILKGLKTPTDCKLFGKQCIPEKPAGACMVSPEGSCQTYYHYDKKI